MSSNFLSTLKIPQKNIIRSLEEMKALAHDLARVLTPPYILLLRGDLGAGKTTFSQYFIKDIMGASTEVTSPTYNVVHTYSHEGQELWHADLYRLEEMSELEELGLWDAFTYAGCLIEWPEILNENVPERSIQVQFKILPDGKREVLIEPSS